MNTQNKRVTMHTISKFWQKKGKNTEKEVKCNVYTTACRRIQHTFSVKEIKKAATLK